MVYQLHDYCNNTNCVIVNRKYEGTSKGMEGAGVINICEQMKKDGYHIVSISHDNDASTMKHISEAFPKAIEKLDPGHAAKNIYKKVKELGKEFSELYGFGERVRRRFNQVTHSCGGDPMKFRTDLLNSLKHWCDDHTTCKHESGQTRRYHPLVANSNAAKALEAVLLPYAENSSKYAGVCHHHIITIVHCIC